MCVRALIWYRSLSLSQILKRDFTLFCNKAFFTIQFANFILRRWKWPTKWKRGTCTMLVAKFANCQNEIVQLSYFLKRIWFVIPLFVCISILLLKDAAQRSIYLDFFLVLFKATLHTRMQWQSKEKREPSTLLLYLCCKNH